MGRREIERIKRGDKKRGNKRMGGIEERKRGRNRKSGRKGERGEGGDGYSEFV